MNLTEKKLETEVYHYLLENNISVNSTIIVGLSGGPDSTALLLSLTKISCKFHLNIKAAYINHGMRDSNLLEIDDKFVKNLSNLLDVELIIYRIGDGVISGKAQNEGRSSEDVAREFRYAFFNRLIESDNTYLALGHNLDDQFETMITRYFQGAGISGLKGIPHHNGSIIRPLNKIRKDEILKYLSDEEQGYCSDHTNAENTFLRNRIRNKLIPEIEEIFPGYTSALSTLQKRFVEISDFFDFLSQSIEIEYSDSQCKVSLEKFNKAHKLIRLNILYKMFDFTYKGNVKSLRVPERFFSPLLYGTLGSRKTYANAYGIKIISRDDVLCFERFQYESNGFYALLDNRETIIPGRYGVTIEEHSSIKIRTVFDSPLIFRSRSEGDSIDIDDKVYSLKKLFSQWGLTEKEKNMVPIIEDSHGIIAVLGEIIGFKNFFRNKKIHSSEKFNILYLEVRQIFQE